MKYQRQHVRKPSQPILRNCFVFFFFFFLNFKFEILMDLAKLGNEFQIAN